MNVAHVVGVDPGIVHTGVVSLGFLPQTRHIVVRDFVVNGLDTHQVSHLIGSLRMQASPNIFIEGYRPRSTFGTDAAMVAGVSTMRKALPGSVVLQNTGIKKVVRRRLLELLGVWQFATPTHHQDLRSAARIAVLGMLKHPELNELLADVVADHLAGNTWTTES